MALLVLKNFCFCCDLRRGCIVYAWIQMMIVTILGFKFSWLQNINQAFEGHISYMILSTLQLSVLTSLQLIKAVTSIALIWGIVKKNHMFYQPWLFINGLENAIFVLVTGASFVIACLDPFFFRFLPFFGIVAVYGWYIWACVFVVYRRDMKPNTIAFDANYDNFNMNNINVTV